MLWFMRMILLLMYGSSKLCVELPGVRVQWVKGYHHDNHTPKYFMLSNVPTQFNYMLFTRETKFNPPKLTFGKWSITELNSSTWSYIAVLWLVSISLVPGLPSFYFSVCRRALLCMNANMGREKWGRPGNKARWVQWWAKITIFYTRSLLYWVVWEWDQQYSG